MANYKEYRIAVDNNIVNLERVDSAAKERIVSDTRTASDAITSPSTQQNNISKLIAIDAAKRAANFAAQNYGNLTGDGIGQTQLNEAIGFAGMIGMAATGPLGMAAAGMQLGLIAANRFIDVSKSRNVSKTMQARMGIISGGRR